MLVLGWPIYQGYFAGADDPTTPESCRGLNGEPLYSFMTLCMLTQRRLQAATRPDGHNLHDMSGSLRHPLCRQVYMHAGSLSLCVE